MLYRNPDHPARVSLLARVLHAASEFGRSRRRRLAELDLLSMNGHLKRDLGLIDADVLSRRQ